eukprot:gene7638-11960_t
MKKQLSVAVIGAGFSGQMFSLFANKNLKNMNITLFEKFVKPEAVGAGIALQPLVKGLKALYDYDPNISNRILYYGEKIKDLRILNKQHKQIMNLHYDKLHPNLHGIGVQRQTLFNELYQEIHKFPEIKVKLGTEIIEVETDTVKNQHQNYLKDINGKEYGPFDMVVVSDGQRSVLREFLSKTDQDFGYYIHDFAWCCLWTIVNECEERKYKNTLLQVLNTCAQMVGYMPSGCNQQDATNKFSFFWSIHKRDYEKWKNNEITLDELKQEIYDLDPKFSVPLLDQIKTKEQLQFANYKNVKAKNTGKRNIIFIGDSFHATSPVLGQGTNLALMDALVLSQCLSKIDQMSIALKEFTSLRKSSCNFIQNTSSLLNPVFQSNIPFLHHFRDNLAPIFTNIPFIEKEGLLTQSGLKKSLFSNYNVEEFAKPFQNFVNNQSIEEKKML